jgi:DNA-binding NtrC family response regulator
MHYDDTATILVVEDDDATRTFLADNLTADGFELLVADCARDGARLMETKFPDLALIDVGLPDGSGLDLVRRVREADGPRLARRPADAAAGHQRARRRARSDPRLRARRR